MHLLTEADPTTNERLQRRWQRRTLTGVCWILAFSFAGGGITKYMAGETFFGPSYSEKFSDWGYPSWFRFVVGTAELVAAALLVTPRRRIYGAAILIVVLVGAVITHIANQDPLNESVSAPINLAIVLGIAWSTRPNDLRDLWPGRIPRERLPTEELPIRSRTGSNPAEHVVPAPARTTVRGGSQGSIPPSSAPTTSPCSGPTSSPCP